MHTCRNGHPLLFYVRFYYITKVFLVTGTIKGLATNQLEEIGCQIILGNTYHLALRPTSELIDELGGLHNFMNWPRALLTDSGGFQMVVFQAMIYHFESINCIYLFTIGKFPGLLPYITNAFVGDN